MIAITILDDELVETVETFRVNLSRVIGGARLGETTSVTISIPPNDSPLGSFGFLELEVSLNSVLQVLFSIRMMMLIRHCRHCCIINL